MNLEKIARMAGVSRSTVSRVINNHPYVSDNIRQRVLAIIEREGFQPNAAARMLVRQRTDVIAVIAPQGLGAVLSEGYFPVLMMGISSAISQADYAMSLWAGTTTEESQRMYKRILGYKLMDGALLITAIEGDLLPQRLVERKMPLVLIGHTKIPEISTVDIDNILAARNATEHLIRSGKRRIGHITGSMNIISAHHRFQGYRESLESHGIPYDPELVVDGDFSEQAGSQAAQKLLALGVDGVFTSNDQMAVGFVKTALARGLSLPRDVSVVGFDDLPIASTFIPAITTMRQPIREIGVTAIRLLLGIIDGTVTESQHIRLPTELVVRDT